MENYKNNLHLVNLNKYDAIYIIGRGSVAQAIYQSLPTKFKLILNDLGYMRYLDEHKHTYYKHEGESKSTYKTNYFEALINQSIKDKKDNKKTLYIFANMYGTKWKINQGIISDDHHVSEIEMFLDILKNHENVDVILISSIDVAMTVNIDYNAGLYARNRLTLEKKFIEWSKESNVNNTNIIRLPMLKGIGKNWMYDLETNNLLPNEIHISKADSLKFTIISNRLKVWIDNENVNEGFVAVKYLDQYLNENKKYWLDLGYHLNMDSLNENSRYVIFDLYSSDCIDKLMYSIRNKPHTLVTAYDYSTTIHEYLQYVHETESKTNLNLFQSLNSSVDVTNLKFYGPKIDQTFYIQDNQYRK